MCCIMDYGSRFTHGKKELKLIYVLAIKADRNNLLVKVYCK